MAWSTPLTAVANAALTAAQWNASVRDNLLMTAPALVSATGQILVSTAANALAARTVTSALVATSETSASTTYVDLTTGGPAVTVTTGPAAIVMLYCDMWISSASGFAFMGYAVSGATTLAAADGTALQTSFTTGNRWGAAIMQTGLTAGSNTFTAKYRTSVAGTGTWLDRRIAVIPL